jgi:hypothetical protein
MSPESYGERLRRQAADCRRAVGLGKPPNRYLTEMAERYEREAAELEQFAGSKPGKSGSGAR